MLALALSASGCPVPALFAPDQPPREDVVIAPVGPVLDQPPPAPRPRVRVVWRGKVPAELGPWSELPNGTHMTAHVASLLGADAKKQRAFFTRSPLRSAPWFEVVEVPLSEETPDQPPTSRWQATTGDAHMRGFYGFGGVLADDLARYADIVETTGPFVTRSRDAMSGPQMAVSKDAILFEGQRDELHVADRKGQHDRRFVILPAAYDPIFSADGSVAAFRGCHSVPQVPGKLVMCQYHLYVARNDEPKPVRINAVIQPQPPVFSPDGRYVYTVSRDDAYLNEPKDRGGCLWRVSTDKGHDAVKLWCTTTLRNLDFHQDPTGATGVVEGYHEPPGVQVQDVVWVDLPDGKVRKTVSVDRGTGLSALGKDGMFATNAQGGAVYVDLASGEMARVKEAVGQLTFYSGHWADDTSVYAMRQRTGRVPIEEVIAIDIRAMIDGE